MELGENEIDRIDLAVAVKKNQGDGGKYCGRSAAASEPKIRPA
ncbi:MAG TPA: hypothetical protein VI231_21140 [Candidatus Binatia bacterium]